MHFIQDSVLPLIRWLLDLRTHTSSRHRQKVHMEVTLYTIHTAAACLTLTATSELSAATAL